MLRALLPTRMTRRGHHTISGFLDASDPATRLVLAHDEQGVKRGRLGGFLCRSRTADS